ncbi:MAG: ASPIC/UnbV domain-containing protein [Streptosporangiaceae bacterium]
MAKRNLLKSGRTLVPGVVAILLAAALLVVARLPHASEETRQRLASAYRFTEMPIAMPAGYAPVKTVRKVNPHYELIRSWISSVGAGIALNDLLGTGRADGMCLSDPRSDQVVVTYAPTAPAADRFTPFTLTPAPTLPMDGAMAPMGCVPGDYNEDGRTDLLVYYWGRTPVVVLARADARTLSNAAYRPVELVAQVSVDGQYHGPRWNTNAVNVGDFDGTGHPHILVSNYFPDSDVLDPDGLANVVMNSSMSNAKNGGGAHLLRWYGAASGDKPDVRYTEVKGAIPYGASTGWTLAISGADLTGDGRSELYLANDFGKDHLLYNISTPGNIRFQEAIGDRSPTDPKSFVLGHSSFKGMGIDFGDINNKGRFDMVVSNITTAWGLEESNFAWMNDAKNEPDMARKLASGLAPFTQRAREMGFAFTGWGWDLKMGDFTNNGNLEIVQAEGFVKGDINRWPWLQEMAMTNDSLFTNPKMWPNIQPGDDLAGSQPVAFYSKEDNGRFANISGQLGLAAKIPTRGVAMADTRGTGALDLALARQWGPPVFYANDSPGLGNYLDLQLYRPVTGAGGGLRGLGSPAYGANVQIRTADGHTQISQLDGGGGHSGKRSFQVHFGLGQSAGPVTVTLRWSDAKGLHDQTLELAPGNHRLVLDSTAAQEVTSS